MEQDDLHELNLELWTWVHKNLEKAHDPLGVAALMMATSLMIYKTVLSPDDYDKMVDAVSDSRAQVSTFDPDEHMTLQ